MLLLKIGIVFSMEGGGNDKKRGYKEYVFSSFVTSLYWSGFCDQSGKYKADYGIWRIWRM